MSGRKILVLESEKTAAYSFCKALCREGYAVVACSHLPVNPAFCSIYITEKKRCPNIEDDYNVFFNWLMDEVRHNDYITVISFSDKTTKLLSEKKDILSRHTFIYQPEIHITEKVLDKSKTYESAFRVGLDLPRVYAWSKNDSPESLAERIEYPVVLKPLRKILYNNGKAIFLKVNEGNYVWSKQEFKDKFNAILGSTTEFEIQEYIRGMGRGYFTIMWEGKPMVHFAHERIREYPVSGGASSFRKSIDYHEMEKPSVKLLNEIQWNGPAMVEYKYDPVRKKYFLMEVNGRWWGSLPLAINAGINFPLVLLRLIEKKEISQSYPYPLNFTSRLLFPHDIMWLLNCLMKMRLSKAREFFKHSDSEDIFDVYDMKPFFANIISTILQYFYRSKR